MATRALIIGKDKSGKYHYGQTMFDGMDNLEWLRKNMNDVDKVEDFLHYITEGIEDCSGDGHGIDCLTYKRTITGFRLKYDETQPIIEWREGGYNCGISKTKKAVLELVKQRHFDYPEYISYWDGKKWKNI